MPLHDTAKYFKQKKYLNLLNKRICPASNALPHSHTQKRAHTHTHISKHKAISRLERSGILNQQTSLILDYAMTNSKQHRHNTASQHWFLNNQENGPHTLARSGTKGEGVQDPCETARQQRQRGSALTSVHWLKAPIVAHASACSSGRTFIATSWGLCVILS